MKSLTLLLTVLFATAVCPTSDAHASEDLKAVQKRHRQLRHEESKKWAKLEMDCKSKYPTGLNPDDKDYDARFKCDESVRDVQEKFENGLRKEICEKFKISCNKQ